MRAQTSMPSVRSSAASWPSFGASTSARDRVAGRFVCHQRRAMTSGVFFPLAGARRPRAARGRGRHARELPPSGRAWPGRCPASRRCAGRRPTHLSAARRTDAAAVRRANWRTTRAAQFRRHQVGVGQGTPESGRGQQPARAQLPRLALGRAIQELERACADQPPVADDAQGVLGADMQQVVQLLAEMSGLRLVDERLGRGDQGADAGERTPSNDHSPRWSTRPVPRV